MTYKTLLIIIAVFLLAGLGVGFFIFKERPVETVRVTETAPEGFFPASSEDARVPARDSQGQSQGGAFSLEKPSTGSDQTRKALSLRQFVAVPVSGATILEHKDDIVVRYIERESGHVLEMALNEKVPTKVTNTTLPKTTEVLWGPKGETLIIRALDGPENRLETVFAQVVKPKQATSTDETRRLTFGEVVPLAVGSLEGALLPSTIRAVTASPSRDKIFFLLETADGVSGVVSDFIRADTAHGQLPVYSSPFRDWHTQWASANSIALTTKPASGVPGYLYLLNTTSKSQEKLLDAVPGLTALVSPKGNLVIYARAQGSGFTTFILDKTSRESVAFPLQTLPEKCVFSVDEKTVFCSVPDTVLPGLYPDHWYQGVTSWNDALWEVDINTGEATRLVSASDFRLSQTLDAVDLQLSTDGRLLLLRNKRDSTLWVLEM